MADWKFVALFHVIHGSPVLVVFRQHTFSKHILLFTKVNLLFIMFMVSYVLTTKINSAIEKVFFQLLEISRSCNHSFSFLRCSILHLSASKTEAGWRSLFHFQQWTCEPVLSVWCLQWRWLLWCEVLASLLVVPEHTLHSLMFSIEQGLADRTSKQNNRCLCQHPTHTNGPHLHYWNGKESPRLHPS